MWGDVKCKEKGDSGEEWSEDEMQGVIFNINSRKGRAREAPTKHVEGLGLGLGVGGYDVSDCVAVTYNHAPK